MPVSTVREEVNEKLDRWQMMDDLVSHRVKESDNVKNYLPMPNPTDTSDENIERYKQYVARAVLINYLKRTLESLVGTVLQKEPVVNMPPALDYLKAAMDASGRSMSQVIRNSVSSVLTKGRYFLLASYPNKDDYADSDGFVSNAVARENNLRGYISAYHPSKVINWKTHQLGSEEILTMVVLEESYVDDDTDVFNPQVRTQYRVLMLGELKGHAGEIYYQQIYRDEDPFGDPIVPKNSKGKPFTRITGTFVGAYDNSPSVDDIPLFDIAEVNIAHLRNSADFEESSFILGQPQVTATGMTEHWIQEVWKGKMYFGSRAVLTGPVGSAFNILQAKENTMASKGMTMKENQIVHLGAQLVMPGKSTKTATEAEIENRSDNSVLATIADNVSDAMTRVVQWVAEYNGAPSEGIEIKLNTDYGARDATPQQITAWLAAVTNGAMSLQTFLENMYAGNQLKGSDVKKEIVRLANRQEGVDEDGDVDTITENGPDTRTENGAEGEEAES